MPLTPAEIKHQQQIRNAEDAPSWVSPNFGDGGWHNTPGTQRFTTEWEPMGDRLLVALDNDAPLSDVILTPQTALRDTTTRIGTVLKCGPGKWKPGEWWWVKDGEPINGVQPYDWCWFPAERIPMAVKPGNRIVLGRWTDWESADAGWGQNIVLCQEADIRVVLS